LSQKIVKPDANPEEIEQALENNKGPIFSQQVRISKRKKKIIQKIIQKKKLVFGTNTKS